MEQCYALLHHGPEVVLRFRWNSSLKFLGFAKELVNLAGDSLAVTRENSHQLFVAVGELGDLLL